MKSLTIIKDEEGKIKVANFGNYRQCDWSDEPVKSGSQLIDEFRNYLVKFTLDKIKMKKLLDSIKNVSFYTSKDSGEFYKMFQSNRKQDIEIYDKFFDDMVGIYVLDNLINTNTKGLKLHDYSTRMNDSMFVDLVFVIDFQKRCAEMFIRGRSYEKVDFDSKTLSSTEQKIVKEVKEDVSRKDESKSDGGSEETGQGGRVGLW